MVLQDKFCWELYMLVNMPDANHSHPKNITIEPDRIFVMTRRNRITRNLKIIPNWIVKRTTTQCQHQRHRIIYNASIIVSDSSIKQSMSTQQQRIASYPLTSIWKGKILWMASSMSWLMSIWLIRRITVMVNVSLWKLVQLTSILRHRSKSTNDVLASER